MHSNPMIICDACGESRDCLLHRRAEFPPDAAKAWMKRHCHNDPKGCKLRYQAGFAIGGPAAGMSE
jgi:hypothetical protein